jgi:2-polyprenyl-3-methyl-5-hydroxy-6-metoxy-1,4-benzoquinol methylase
MNSKLPEYDEALMREARYMTFPGTEPYRRVDPSRLHNPKAVFRHALGAVRRRLDGSKPLSVADIGTANGEFLYYVSRECPHWKLTGFDDEKNYIDVARDTPELSSVAFEVCGLYDMQGQFDVVTFLGTLSTFWDLEKALF